MNITKDKALFSSLLFTLLCILTYVYDFIFRDGDYFFRISVVILSIWVFYFVYKRSFLKKSRISFYLIEIFIFASVYLGRVIRIYNMVPIYDKLLHLTSGVIAALIGYVFFLSLIDSSKEDAYSPYLGIIFSISFATAVAGVWEIWEFSTDQIFGLTAQNNSLYDTMLDIISGTIMGVLTNVPIIMHMRGHKFKFIEKMIDEMK